MENPRQRMMRLRGEAINAYAGIEGALCGLLAVVGGMSYGAAKIIFFRIVNTRARNEILADLKKQMLGDEFQVFWKSLFKLINTADSQRNEIVHWHVRQNIQIDGQRGTRSHLELYRAGAEYPQATKREADLKDFIALAEFLASTIDGFRRYLAEKTDETPSPVIYQQELVYPDSVGQGESPRKPGKKKTI